MTTENRQKVNPVLLQPHEDEHHLMDYVRILYKRRWIAIPAFLIVFLVGAINSVRTTPIYEARTQLLIEKDAPKVGRLDTMFQESDGWYNDDFYQTQYRILQSRSLARHTVELMNLPNHPSLKKALEPTTAPITLTGLAYGAVDEWTQALPFINRSCDIADWHADAAGTATAVVLGSWILRKRET